jgi:hypothetical protein
MVIPFGIAYATAVTQKLPGEFTCEKERQFPAVAITKKLKQFTAGGQTKK